MNTSGIQPLDLRVLVLPDPVAEKVGSIFVPDSTKEKEKFGAMKGTLIAVGSNAWNEASKAPQFVKPRPGDRVLISKYGGVMLTGDDGKEYRIMNDDDITALLTGGN